MKDKGFEAARMAFQIEAQCLAEAFSYIDEAEFAKAVDVLAAAPRIAASGCGHTSFAVRHFVHLMCCIERPARFISTGEAVHGGAGYIQKGDVMLLASRGGKTSELLPILRICKAKDAAVIAVTENMQSPLAVGSDIVLRMHVTREVDPFNTQGTTSNAMMNALFDALQAALIEETGFTTDSFALVHPGGAVGERLNSRGLIW